jgi:hypothetical protein
MTWFLFVGDMLVTAFMIVLFVWISLSTTRAQFDAVARIPLEDEERRG